MSGEVWSVGKCGEWVGVEVWLIGGWGGVVSWWVRCGE